MTLVAAVVAYVLAGEAAGDKSPALDLPFPVTPVPADLTVRLPRG